MDRIIESLPGTKKPRLEGVPRRGEISGVTPEGDRFLGGDWKEGDENYPATQDTRGAKKAPGISMNAGRHGTEMQTHLQRDGMASMSIGGDRDQEASMRVADTAVAVGLRTEHRAIREYVTLASEETAGDPAVAGTPDSERDPKEIGTEKKEKEET